MIDLLAKQMKQINILFKEINQENDNLHNNINLFENDGEVNFEPKNERNHI